jgi:hypothetical protein
LACSDFSKINNWEKPLCRLLHFPQLYRSPAALTGIASLSSATASLLPRSPRFTCVPPASTPWTQCRLILVPTSVCACWQQCAQAVRRNANQDGVSCTASMAVKKLVRAHRSGLDAVFCLCARAAGASCSLRTWFLLGRVNPPTWYVGASDHPFSRVLVVAAYCFLLVTAYCFSASGYFLISGVSKKKYLTAHSISTWMAAMFNLSTSKQDNHFTCLYFSQCLQNLCWQSYTIEYFRKHHKEREMPIRMSFFVPRPWPSTSWVGLIDQVWDAAWGLFARATGASCNSRQGFLLGRVNPSTWYVGASDHHLSRVLLVAA